MSGNPEVDKAVNQMQAQRPPVDNAAEVVDKAVGVYTDTDSFYENGANEPAPSHPSESDKPAKKKAAKKSSGNRAVKQDSEEE